MDFLDLEYCVFSDPFGERCWCPFVLLCYYFLYLFEAPKYLPQVDIYHLRSFGVLPCFHITCFQCVSWTYIGVPRHFHKYTSHKWWLLSADYNLLGFGWDPLFCASKKVLYWCYWCTDCTTKYWGWAHYPKPKRHPHILVWLCLPLSYCGS